MIKLICFDLGNVLVRLQDRDIVTVIAEPQAAEYVRLTQMYGVGGLQPADFLHALKRLFKWQCDVSDIESWFIHHRIKGLQPGADELLARLYKRGVPVALLSNINASHWAYLKRFELFQRCSFKLLSYQQHCAKPDVKIYQRLEAMSGFCGAEIAFFDDLEENIHTAKSLGWLICQVHPATAIDDVHEFLSGRSVL